jgi:hypothetical protein
MIDPAAYVSASDSSATMMRAVAAALCNEWMIPERWPAYLVALTRPANRLPAAWRGRLVAHFMRNVGVSPALAAAVTAAGLAQWATQLYGSAPTNPLYDTIVLGAPSGGIAHLAALLGAPFLSQHFVTRYRYRGPADDVAAYQAFGAQLGETILGANPDLSVINHYDPLHDRFLIPYVNYIRMKLLDLPGPYVEFIRSRLRPGGALLYADCQYNWGQYRIGKRHFFQVGGLGGVADTDFVRDAGPTAHFLATHGAPAGQHDWALPSPWLEQPESEWGSLPPFRQAVEDFAEQNGYRFRVVRGAHPEDFAQLAFYAAYQAALNAGREPAGVLVDCFTQTSPTAALQAGLLPLWLPFNCTDSLDFLTRMAPDFPVNKPVLLAPAPGFSPAWDAVSAHQWQAACGPDHSTVWMGVDPAAHPMDIAGIFRFVPALQAWCAQHPRVAHPPFTVADLEALIGGMATAQAAEQVVATTDKHSPDAN